MTQQVDLLQGNGPGGTDLPRLDLVPVGSFDPADPRYDWAYWQELRGGGPVPRTPNELPQQNLSNPPLHPTLASRQGLRRGSISRYANAKLEYPSDGGPPVIKYDRNQGVVFFRFGFNPDRIGLGWTVAADQTVPDMEETGRHYLAGHATVDFQLLIDRTAEVAEGTMERGVLNDLAVLQRMTGSKSKTNHQGIIFPTPLDFNFGGPNSFRMWGVIQHMSVDLTHYTPGMVPTRAVISMGVTRWADVSGFSGGTNVNESGVMFNPAAPLETNALLRDRQLQERGDR